MRFEWDEDMRRRILKSRGFDLLTAVRIFEGPVLTELDMRYTYGEDRYISIGKVEEDYFVVVHTARKNAVRLVTAWRAGRSTRRRYQKRYPG
jgi:uncharacterized DUF497 family protein